MHSRQKGYLERHFLCLRKREGVAKLQEPRHPVSVLHPLRGKRHDKYEREEEGPSQHDIGRISSHSAYEWSYEISCGEKQIISTLNDRSSFGNARARETSRDTFRPHGPDF